MKRLKVSALLTTVLAGVLAASVAAPASADPLPQPKDIVGVGSDTTEYVMNFLADGVRAGGILRSGYNSGGPAARLVSFNATNPYNVSDTSLVLRAGATPITRPNGSGSGKKTLYTNAADGAVNVSNVNFARSSSGPSANENTAGLYHVPYAVDGLLIARATTSNAPANLTKAELVQIYTGAVTTWNQLNASYSTATIAPKIPQAGSGTRSFFLAQLGIVENQLGANVTSVQEHDAAGVSGQPNAIVPFSLARYNTQATGTDIATVPGFAPQRAVYNVVRAADLTKPFFASIFGPSGFLCSGAGNTLIKAAGFTQLQGPSTGGVCGVAVQAAPTAAQLALVNP